MPESTIFLTAHVLKAYCDIAAILSIKEIQKKSHLKLNTTRKPSVKIF